MNAFWILIAVVSVLTIAYRYYSAFIAARVIGLDDSRPTPAHRLNDGHNYFPTKKWVLFGHHFAAITGAGPLIGPVLAAQFGYLPGLLWLVIGVVLGGAVHDFVILCASVRRDGRSLAQIARDEVGPVAGLITGVAILFIIVIALAGLGLAVVNALRDSAWGVVTIGASIPIALYMGLHMYRLRPGATKEATVIGIVLLMAALFLGRFVAKSDAAPFFLFSEGAIVVAMALYGFVASILPVWMLLCPRDYLSSFMKIGTIVMLAIGVLIVHPEMKMPAVSSFAGGGGPIIPGKVFPFVFITIACGAISGFHALVGSGTTPKMVDKESHCRPIGYGAMLIEGAVGVLALVAACCLEPSDYFAINATQAKFDQLGMEPVELPALSAAVGESLQGRTGGAVSLATGMAKIFSGIPFLAHLMEYWYHFAIMFEALFIMTTIDTGTRVARFFLQEFGGRVYPRFAQPGWIPGTLISSAVIVLAWAGFLATGSISTIWPMFGTANQLLASIALCVGTTFIINRGKARYAWVTLLPLAFVATTTLTAAVLNITDNFFPMTRDPEPGKRFQGWLNSGLTLVIIACAVTVIGTSLLRWTRALARPAASAASA